ncbi:amino acid adenylation domain-containing protein [Kitasatospora acidiphila]|nr:amino acid adenylation domain-containing protein [Kitasatospora acidiphila]
MTVAVPQTAISPAEREARIADLLAAEYVRPDWGLGDGSGAGVHREPLDGAEPAAVLAAAAVVLSRYDHLDRLAVLGLARGGAPDSLAALPVGEDQPVAELLRAAEDRLARPGPADTPELAARLARADGGGAVSVQLRLPTHGRAERAVGNGRFPLTVTVERGRLRCDYRREAFSPVMVAQFARHLARVSRQLAAAGPDTPLSAIALLDESERGRVVALCAPGRSVPEQRDRIDQLVRARAAERPSAVAVRCGERDLTYRQLDARADQIAKALGWEGLRPGDRVGVCLERSAELITLLLGVLRAGGVYVPMEPGYPAERLAHTAADAGLALVVTELADFPAGRARLLHPAELAALADRFDAGPVPRHGSPDDPAYVIYTSGSTGRPKGVVVTHRNVTSLIAGTSQDFRFGPADVWALFHSVAFDMSVWEIWGALTTGGRLVVVPSLVCRAPGEFHAQLAAERVTVLNQTPSAFAQLIEADQAEPRALALRLVSFGGEPLDTRMLLPWFDRHPETDCRMVNLYGITETTVHSTWQVVGRAEALAASRSVGTALPGEHLYVRDRHGRLLPPGVAGEIYVGGAGVAAGYLNRPELNAERFLPDPDRGGRMYRSGDQGRLLPSGRLEHLGRLDGQVKLRGYRIELDEVRAVLLEDPAVLAAAVVLNRPDPGDPATDRLDAYVVLGDGDPAAVRERAARLLPGYMMPSTVTALPALPLTVNGKLDRSLLPQPALAPHAPAGQSVQERVHHAWQSIVGRPIGLDDNFFDTGGNSMLVGRLVRRLPELGLPKPSLRQTYVHSTVRRLAALLEELQAAG